MSEPDYTLPELVPLFPLPGIVLFPRVAIPLHLFEPRYKLMARHAINGHRHLAIALLKPGFEPQYYTNKAPIHPIVGVGRIIAAEELADGRFNILLQGLSRARVVQETNSHSFRMGRIEAMNGAAGDDEDALAGSRARLAEMVEQSWSNSAERTQWLSHFECGLTLGDVCDLIAADLPLDAELKQSLLTEPSAVQRSDALCGHLDTLEKITRAKKRQVRDATLSRN